MKVRIGGPLPIRFEMNALMIVGVVLGGVGVAIAAVAHFAGPSGGIPWDDVGLGVILLGMALYFLGRIVDLVAYFRRKR